MRKEQFGELKAYVTGGRDGEGEGDGPVVILMQPGIVDGELGSALGSSNRQWSNVLSEGEL
jgi:hypothetical protein